MPLNATYSGYVAFAETDRVLDGGPVGIDEARALINNALWAVDYAGRFLVQWWIQEQTHERKPDGSGGGSSTSEWYPIEVFDLDVHLRDDGAYRLVCMVGGRSTNTAFGNAKFRLAIGHPDYVDADLRVGTSLPNVMEVTSSSSTHAWLNTGTVLTVPSDQVELAIVHQRTVTAIGGASTSIPVCRLKCLVAAQPTHVQTEAALSGVVVREWYGS